MGCELVWAVGIVLDGGPEVLGDAAMATNFGTQFAITGFVGYNFGCMIASNTLFDSGSSKKPQLSQSQLSVNSNNRMHVLFHFIALLLF